MSHGNLAFGKDKIIYGYDDKAKELQMTRRPFTISAPKAYNH